MHKHFNCCYFAFTSQADSSIMLNFSDLESAALELKPRKLILKVKEAKIEYLKKIFQLEPWNHNNCTDGL